MKLKEGIFMGVIISAVACVAWTVLFPRSKEEMCHAVRKISKDMEKDLGNMM